MTIVPVELLDRSYEIEIEDIAKQMPEDVLMSFYDEIEENTRNKAERKHNIQLVEELLETMEDYKSKINNHLMSEIVDRLDTAITDIECLKCDFE